jgi:hypothetical protein
MSSLRKQLYCLILGFLSFNVFAEKVSYDDLMQAFDSKYVLVDTKRAQACFSLSNGDVKAITKSRKCDEVEEIFITRRGAICITTRSREDCRRVRVTENGSYVFGGKRRPIKIYNSRKELLKQSITLIEKSKYLIKKSHKYGNLECNQDNLCYYDYQFKPGEGLKTQDGYVYNYDKITKYGLKLGESESVVERKGQTPILWKLSGKNRISHISICESSMNTVSGAKDGINSFGITVKDFCNCTANKMPQQYDSLGEYLSVEDPSSKKVVENCLNELLSNNESEWSMPEPARGEFIKNCTKNIPKNDLSIESSDMCVCSIDRFPKYFKSPGEFFLLSNNNVEKVKHIMIRVAAQCMLDLTPIK